MGGLIKVGRRFDGEAGNFRIKDDASAHTPDACVAHLYLALVQAGLQFAFLGLSGSMNRVEECMGQDLGILRGRILARLRIRGMRRFNKTRRPKLRILMLDPAGFACAS
ncbi:LOW QUALITY PROTEIN: hypothetical protein YC2023_040998 [Brassica napus]